MSLRSPRAVSFQGIARRVVGLTESSKETAAAGIKLERPSEEIPQFVIAQASTGRGRYTCEGIHALLPCGGLGTACGDGGMSRFLASC